MNWARLATDHRMAKVVKFPHRSQETAHRSLVDIGAQNLMIQIDPGDTETLEFLVNEIVPKIKG